MHNFYSNLNAITTESKSLNTSYKPIFFRIQNQKDKNELNQLLTLPGLIVINEIYSQLTELIKYNNPTKKFTSTEIERLIQNHLGTNDINDYGVWVFYPWSRKLVHILDENEFVSLRTSRNQYKITPQEKQILSHKKIGVIGLSVGQSVSVTLAMERVCGELRLADFDVLELTNLNRIRTGIHNLGLPKVYSVAREISEIDPFLKVVCFPDGLTEKNMEQFFLDDGKLDLLVEESDGFDIKLLSRYKAKQLKVPVIMEASDRCMVDVERFDLEPERSILHGLVDHLDLNTLKSLTTTEEKIPYMLDILGIETASLRLKASMLEIEQSITTWPQLASAVTMGGGITADVSRRLLLNQYTDSGRYHIDIEKLICNKESERHSNSTQTQETVPNDDLKHFVSMANHVNSQGQIDINQNQIELILTAACKSPSGGNAQPWRWVYKNKTLFLFKAFDSNSNFLGFDNLASCIALGAATETVVLKAAELNLEARPINFPNPQHPDLIVVFEFYPLQANIEHLKSRISAIDYRLTNRLLNERTNIEVSILQDFVSAAEETPNAKLTFFTKPSELEKISEILGELEKIRILEKWGHHDFVEEVRWTKEEAEQTLNGVDLRTLDLSNTEKVGLQLSRNSELIELLNNWNGGNAFKKLTKKSIDAASAIGIITLPGSNQQNFLNGGRILQRVWLEANAKGIAFQPVSASVFLFARYLRGNGKGLSEKACEQLKKLRPDFEKTFSITPGYSDIFIFRLCQADEPKIKSLRKPLKDVFKFIQPIKTT